MSIRSGIEAARRLKVFLGDLGAMADEAERLLALEASQDDMRRAIEAANAELAEAKRGVKTAKTAVEDQRMKAAQIITDAQARAATIAQAAMTAASEAEANALAVVSEARGRAQAIEAQAAAIRAAAEASTHAAGVKLADARTELEEVEAAVEAKRRELAGVKKTVQDLADKFAQRA